MAATAVFTDLREFLDELDADAGEIAREIVRVSQVGSPVAGSAVTAVRVEAGYRVGGEIVKLRVYCGELWGTRQDDEVREKAQATVKRLDDAIRERGLECRAGVYEEGARKS